MVNLTIDNINVSVPEGTTIMDAAKMADIPIPKLCYLKDINEIGACRVCVVEVKGIHHLRGNGTAGNFLQQRSKRRYGNPYKQPKGSYSQKTDCTAYPFPARLQMCYLCQKR